MFQVGATCYETAAAANAASGSAQTGSVVLIGGQSYVVSFNASSDTSITYNYAPLSGGALVSQTVASSPPVCSLLTADDAIQATWLVGGVWLATYVVMFLIGVLNAHFAPQNDT